MRRTIFTFIALCLFAALASCSSGVDYQTKEKDSSTDTNKYYVTTQFANKVYFYKQNKDADPELSTYLRDTTADVENASIQKGTPLSQLESLKSYVGFTLYTASQNQNVLNLYYKRKQVTYEFYSAKEKGKLEFRTVGLYESKVASPDYAPLEGFFVVGWEDADGKNMGGTYGADDEKFYPRLLAKEEAIGTKVVADTKGDILLDDGTVISYKEFCESDNDRKSKVILHAFGVLVCPNYKPSQIASSAPEEGNDNFYTNNIKGNDSIYSGDKKLIAAVFKRNNALYDGVPWISENDSLLKCSIELSNYFDGDKNASLLKSVCSNDNNIMQGANAFSSCESYGDAYCPNTKFADGWHLPSVGELGVFYDVFFAGADWSNLTALFYNFNASGRVVWTSNANPPSDTDLYTRPLRKSWTVELPGMTTSEKKRSATTVDSSKNLIAIPFLIVAH